MFTVRTNVPALFAHNRAMGHQKDLTKALQRLSTGYRINSAADDAAGLAVSERMRGQIRGLESASRNAQSALSLLQTADGTLSTTQQILQRMRELALQSANGTYSEDERALMEIEYMELLDELDRISCAVDFNQFRLLSGVGGQQGESSLQHIGLLNGSLSQSGGRYQGVGKLVISKAEDGTAHISLHTGDETVITTLRGVGDVELTMKDGSTLKISGIDTDELLAGTITNIVFDGGGSLDLSDIQVTRREDAMYFQIGANSGKENQSSAAIGDMSTGSLGQLSGSGLTLRMTSISSQDSARSALGALDEAIKMVNSQRAQLGASINALERTIDSLATAMENLVAAESRIRDADMAEEMMNFVKSSMLLQAAQAMMSQAMLQPNSIVEMLQRL